MNTPVSKRMSFKLRQWHTAAVFGWLRRLASRPMTLSDRPALVIAPHHDDETLACGGMIAMKRARGVPVTVVFLTDGHQSHAGVADADVSRLMQQRRDEALAATALLGVPDDHVHFLNYPDGKLDALPAAAATGLVDQLVQWVGVGSPEVYVPHRRDWHPDHEAAFRYVHAAQQQAGNGATLLQYPVWMTWMAPVLWRLKMGDLADAAYLKIDPVMEVKARAIAAYHTQHEVLPAGFLTRFACPYEIFFRSPCDD